MATKKTTKTPAVKSANPAKKAPAVGLATLTALAALIDERRALAKTLWERTDQLYSLKELLEALFDDSNQVYACYDRIHATIVGFRSQLVAGLEEIRRNNPSWRRPRSLQHSS
jgi:hypothetical protein